MKVEIEVQKNEIETLGLGSLKQYLLVDPTSIGDDKILTHLLQKAKLGMQFSREMNVSKRAVEANTIRIFRLTAESKSELRSLVKKSLPQYLPT